MAIWDDLWFSFCLHCLGVNEPFFFLTDYCLLSDPETLSWARDSDVARGSRRRQFGTRFASARLVPSYMIYSRCVSTTLPGILILCLSFACSLVHLTERPRPRPFCSSHLAMDKYATKGLDPAPSISMTTIPMAGLLVDVYGLDEAAPSSSTPLTCLWLLHPRTRTRARMADIARRTVHAWHQHATASRARGLIALAFDMPNHGSRLVSEAANQAWDKGNDKHAIDMAAIIQGGAADVSALMGLVAGYLGRQVDAHVCLGWSLGGHAAWWTWFGHDRVDAAVVVVACPDYVGQSFGVLFSPFLTSRSSLSPLSHPVCPQSFAWSSFILYQVCDCSPLMHEGG